MDIVLKQNKIVEYAVRSETLATRAYCNIHNIFTVPCEKSKMVSFTS